MRKILDIALAVLLCGATGICFGAVLMSTKVQATGIDDAFAHLKTRGLQSDVIDSMAVVRQWISSHETTDAAQESRNQATRETVQALAVQQGIMQSQYIELVHRMDDTVWWLRSLLIGVAAQLLASVSWLIKTIIVKPPPPNVSIPCEHESCPYISGRHASKDE